MCLDVLITMMMYDLLQGKAALLEWSFAQSCNASKEPIGEKYLVFYEARTV